MQLDQLVKNHKYWRLLEILPGMASWLALIAPIFIAMYYPVVVASIAIAYAVFWLFRSTRLSVYLIISYITTSKALKHDWNQDIQYNDDPEKLAEQIKKLEQNTDDEKELKRLKKLQKQIQKLTRKGDYKSSKDIHHAIVYVTYKESQKLIETSIKSYTESNYSGNKIIFIFAAEERDQENASKIYKTLKEKYADDFADFILTMHPQDIEGEIKGKSSNATWASKKLTEYADKNHIPHENIILSNFDADTVVHKSYFSELTFKYLTTNKRLDKTYQPTHMYHNNIWDVPLLVRMVALMGTFWRMAESVDKDKFRSFSSRSLSLKTTIDIGYWDPAVIPEDSRQYWTAFVLSNGKHELIPIYCPLYMDAVLSETYVETFKSQYLQLQRWAWGVCDFPFIFFNLIKNKKIKWWTKTYHIYHIFIAHFFWATAAISIAILGWLPGLLNNNFRETVLAYWTPNITTLMLNLAGIGILVSTVVSLLLIPKRPKEKGITDSISLIVQWVFIPITSIFLSSVPAIDAQTRLMLGKRLEYKVTVKARR